MIDDEIREESGTDVSELEGGSISDTPSEPLLVPAVDSPGLEPLPIDHVHVSAPAPGVAGH
jgi:hypothetical protein